MTKRRFFTGVVKEAIFTISIALLLIAGPQDLSEEKQSCCPNLNDNRWNTQSLYDGINWKYAEFEDVFGSPQYLNLIIANADTLAHRVVFAAADSVQPGARRLTPTEFSDYYNTLAAVNAGFFTDHPTYVNTGIFKWEGDVFPFLQQESDEIYFVGGSAVGIDKDGGWIFYNREDDMWPDDWPQAYSAIAGGHRLIEGNKIKENIQNEVYRTEREIRHAGQRHPRTAICLMDSNSILLLVADGRHKEAEGFSLPELARLLLEFGCNEALNLDGGGSSTMVIREEGVVNHPSDNRKFDRAGERAVRTVIVITKPELEQEKLHQK